MAATKVVAIIRGMAPDTCARLSEAYREGGVRLVEVTFDQTGNPAATTEAIRAIRAAQPDMHVGAGTVLTASQLEAAVAAGAEFVVTPGFDPGIVRAAAAAGLVTMPGTFTPTEMVAAHEAGADYIKVFPVRTLGPAYVKDVLAPLKHLKLIAVGGISPENAADYIKAGCAGVGASGSLVNREWIASGEFGRIADVARRLVESCRNSLVSLLVLALVFAATAAAGGYVVAPDADHSAATRRHTGIPSIASARGGRLWATWYGGPTGGEDSNNYCTLATSADGGATWKDVLVADPDGAGPKRAFDPEIWTAPDGRMFWTWTERVAPLQAEAKNANAGGLADPRGDRLMCVEFPGDGEPPSPPPQPRQIARGVMMCKPIVRGDGMWLFPSAHWEDAPSACFYESEDGGRSFSCIGGVTLPAKARAFDEHAVVQLRGGGLLTFIRTNRPENCMESVSLDGGRTWSVPRKARISHTSSRLFLRSLKSGNLLLVKHGDVDEDCGRCRLTAYVSRDDGKTWNGGLLLDERPNASYPDGDQSVDGLVYVVYDRDRLGAQEILMATFTEADVLAGRDISGRVRLRQTISRRLKIAEHARKPKL